MEWGGMAQKNNELYCNKIETREAKDDSKMKMIVEMERNACVVLLSMKFLLKNSNTIISI